MLSVPAVLVVAAGEAQANPISFHLWTFFFQAINVLIVLGVLTKLLFRPISKLMAERERFVDDSLAHAESARNEADKLLQEYREKMRSAQTEAEKMLAQAAHTAEEYKRSRAAAAEAEYEQLLTRARQEIAAEREQALAVLRNEVAGLAIMAAGKVTGKTLLEEDHRRLVAEFAAKAGELN